MDKARDILIDGPVASVNMEKPDKEDLLCVGGENYVREDREGSEISGGK